jgi:hypothetical protein
LQSYRFVIIIIISFILLLSSFVSGRFFLVLLSN